MRQFCSLVIMILSGKFTGDAQRYWVQYSESDFVSSRWDILNFYCSLFCTCTSTFGWIEIHDIQCCRLTVARGYVNVGRATRFLKFVARLATEFFTPFYIYLCAGWMQIHGFVNQLALSLRKLFVGTIVVSSHELNRRFYRHWRRNRTKTSPSILCCRKTL